MPTNLRAGWASWLLRIVLIIVAAAAITFLSVGSYLYFKYGAIVDARLQHPVFANTAKIYAEPREVRPGQKVTVSLIGDELRQAGYTPKGAQKESLLGTYRQGGGSVSVYPGPQSYHAQDSATIHVSDGVVESITDDKGQPLASYELEPVLITGLSEDANRTKRRLVTYDQLPQNLVNAVLAIEDRRFFEHGGVNYTSMLGWAWHDLVGDRKHRGGASTVTMQLAKQLFVADTGTIKYKITQILVAFHLEHRFNKKQIFELYANQVPLGQRGSFAINGFGEAAHAYFGKDVHQLDLSECATLAGLIQSPSYLNPFRHGERAIDRRNLVLDSMVEIGAVTKDDAERAKAESLHLVPGSVDASEAPYFVDLVHDQLIQKLGERDANLEGLRIYTSLDPDLQRLATAAVDSTTHLIDEQVDKVHAKQRKLGQSYVYPQVALVALNPHTGQVLALVGGRSYGTSQVNHAVAHRPTGSIFKPFVYATAFTTAVEGTPLEGQDKLFSPVTILNDQQTTYEVGNQEYTPRNMHGEYHDAVTARYALQWSLNNATISLASMVGFDRVAALAREAGIKSARGTPSVAIGSYDATPLDMAGAYTVFANGGMHIDPWMVASVRTSTGDIVTDYTPTTKQVLDPRVSYLTTNMMEAVLNGGTAGRVRTTYGFRAPAAGKTGTSHDAWFAGFTSNLLCIVWVGNDDYTDIRMEGAHAAAPVWAEFMKKAVELPQYSDTKPFVAPTGVEVISLDKTTNLLADSACPDDYQAAFLSGTAPTDTCDHPPDHRNVFQKIFGLGTPKPGN
ncbi:transglycosylase domain-containing protein [Occallatibacter riparius]|uniref:Transglycosylase domain-containing protein n=1 Tax=Occallatibacter riparius TaxID=1002689 RepID=A0A9J7BUR6_9BACT|nr:transglycosylase domain-containing protein [Occallatibacter riparius]UWZ86619.1 transglycosylase domain-containing protein [Occallatibacter riparius]